jgi:hypothetical protein
VDPVIVAKVALEAQLEENQAKSELTQERARVQQLEAMLACMKFEVSQRRSERMWKSLASGMGPGQVPK